MTRTYARAARWLAAALLLAPAWLPALAPELEPFFQAIRQKESAGHPWSIFDNTTHRSHRLASRADAERLARELVARGHNLDLGLYQLNWHWQRRRASLTLDNVFDPAINEAVARTVFAEFHAAARAVHASAADAIRMAVGAYNNGKVRVHNPGYVNGVYRLAGRAPPYATTGDVPVRGGGAPPSAVVNGIVGAADGSADDAIAPAFHLPAGLVALLDETDAAPAADALSFDAWLLPAALAVAAVAALLAVLLLSLKLVPWLLLGTGRMAQRALLLAAVRAHQRLAAQTSRMAQGR